RSRRRPAPPFQRAFAGIRPLYRLALEPPFLPVLAYVVAGLVGLSVVYRFRSYRMWELALLLGLAGLANMAVRFLQDWLLVMLALGVPHLAVFRRESVLRRRMLGWRERPWSLWSRVVLLGQRLERSAKHVLSTHWLSPQWA